MAFKSSGSGGGFVNKGSGGGFKAKVLPPTGPAIVTDNLIAWLDASNNSSYPGSGTTIYDLSGQSANGTINGTVSWSSNGQASYWNFATKNDTNYISSAVTADYADFTIVFEPDFNLVGEYGIVGLLATGAPSSSYDMSFRFYNANGTGPWQCPNPGNSNDWRTSAGTWYINGTGYTSSLPALSSGWNIVGATRNNNNNTFGSPWAYHLGSSGYPNRNFQGKIAVVLLYSAALTQQQQEQNYNALKSRFGL